MREVEFCNWLSQRRWRGEPLKPGMIEGRARRIARVQRALEALGFDERDLDAVHEHGHWPELTRRLKAIVDDWQSNVPAARAITPRAPDPTRQLNNVYYAMRQYGFFADGRNPNYGVDEDVAEPGEINAVALEALKARFLARFPDFEDGGGFPGESSYHTEEDAYKRALTDRVRTYLHEQPALDDLALGRAILNLLAGRDSNLLGNYRTVERLKAVREANPGVLEEAAGRLARADDDPAEAAAHFLEIMWPLWRHGTEDNLPYGDSRILATVIQGLARPDRAISVIYQRYHNLGIALLGRPLFGNNVLTEAEYRSVLELAEELFTFLEDWGWRPRDLWDVQGFIWVTCKEKLDMDAGRDADRIRQYALETYITPARQRGDTSAKIRCGDVHNALGLTAAHANVCQALRGRKFQEMAGVAVPSFVGPDNSSTTTFTYVLVNGTSAASPSPISTGHPSNLILYGPPGTGKTWQTASEAVRLCDRLRADHPLLRDADRRTELRQRYDQLVEAGQVRLVTFHQSYSYEDFVEGLRPVTDGGLDDEAGVQGAGFRLEAKRGIFREICAIAEDARKNAGRRGGFSLDGRRLFKMSLGRAGLEDHIFEAAIEGDYVVLGWGGDVDWSDPRYDEWSAILERWREENPQATGNDPNVVQMWPFRSTMKTGDIVMVSAGNSHFRAVGEVTGPYRFEPTEVQTYNHRRPVRWLLVPDEPLPVEMIYGKNFMMQSCYQLKDALVKKEALSRLLPGDGAPGDGAPDQFVLIIDEINRANISKVFGELITLIEPDKRLGAGPEALSVRLPYSGDAFGVPVNLHLVGTMNTADRSIALLDTALRRRFVFHEIAPDPGLLPELIDNVPLRGVLEVINDRIEYLVDREHRIGHAFFMGDGGKDRVAIDATMRDKVIPLLQEYFFEDWSRVASVLGERENKGGSFLDCRMLVDPTGQGGEPRPSWSVRTSFAHDAYDRLVGGLSAPALEEAAE